MNHVNNIDFARSIERGPVQVFQRVTWGKFHVDHPRRKQPEQSSVVH